MGALGLVQFLKYPSGALASGQPGLYAVTILGAKYCVGVGILVHRLHAPASPFLQELYWPGRVHWSRHWVHVAEAVAPAVVEYLPDRHGAQVDETAAPRAVEYVPVPQRAHAGEAGAVE